MSEAPLTSVRPPQQARSRRTLERIVEASLEILATEGPAGLTVQAVVDKADSSVGSFYARFKGKDDLLDYLGSRIWTEALERWNQAVVSRKWEGLDFTELVEGSVGLLIAAQRSRSVYLRALDKAAGRQGDAYAAFRDRVLAGVAELLLARPASINHDDPELAVRLGLRAVMGAVEGETRAVGDRMDGEVLRLECRNLLLGYLTGRVDGALGSDVDFFDVWG